MTERLIIPTLKGYRDMMRSAVAENESKAVLLHLQNDDYVLNNGVLYYRGTALSTGQLFSLVSDPDVNKPLKEPLLPYGIFSFMYSKGDLRNNARLETTENELCSFLGVSTGANGFKLIEKLLQFQYVYGVISTKGVFPFLQIEKRQDGRIVLISEYLQHVLNMMLAECFDKYGQRGRFYTNKVHANLVAVRNKTAAMIAIELSRLIVTTGVKGRPHITLQELARYIPQLYAIWTSPHGTGFRNRQLRRSFEHVIEIMQNKSELFNEFCDLEVRIPERLLVSNPKAVIRITHNGYKGV